MCIEIADGAIELATHLDFGQLIASPGESGHDVRQLLADGRRTGRLTMGTRQHWQVGIFAGHIP